ncbi:FAD-dependent monooxygenase [Streptomyces iconiensis]|uniref:FAD-dependent monooxygenase n=1 Tax=Streptomyces iconiensis TaxID=1384038 RepID=A0ABT7A2T1_9ACTN|nr:FAD-dependent monooxygenase [Streptomyces iconiensis]MDJ1135630.1 FAD-dependent monooxygenase [Streptomyces iconiensis]
MSKPRALVIGAGVGGLTAAVALSARGWRVTVLERAPALEPVGAGIAVAPNALRALDVVGLGDAVRALRSWTDEGGGLRTPSGRWLARTTGDKAAARFGDPLVLLARSTLVDLLRSRLPADVTVRTGTPAALDDPGDPGEGKRPATVRTEDGEVFEAELVVAADGIHSATRRALFPAHPGPRYAGFTTWRFLAEAPGERVPPHETWGRGTTWGTQPLPDGRLYAYAAATVPEGQRAPDGERAELMRLFGTWHWPLPQLIQAVRSEDVLRNDVHHMTEPLPAHHAGRTVLIGDAAHAMTPSAGQGGNQSIEDAIVLGQHADPGRDIAVTLAAHTRDRLPRTSEVVRRSARAARMTTLTSGPACALRNAVIGAVTRLAPGAALRVMDGIADWSPPQRTYASQSRSSAHTSGQSRPPGP